MAYAAKTIRGKLMAAVLPAVAGVLVPAALASAQATPGGTGTGTLQREARLRELQQFELDNRYRANPDVPPGQRALIDYGAFVQFSYLSLDDSADQQPRPPAGTTSSRTPG
ncbi:MAG: hypothetical protein QM760_19330 [Nibricoccus sp.]